MKFREKIVQYIEEADLPSAPASVMVAVSGGADSVALLHTLMKLGYKVQAAHCNFLLRGSESERDEIFVRNLANEWNIPIHVQRFQTRQFAQNEGVSIEMAARQLRYAWFEQLRQKEKFEWIAVAHHLDDSIETLLINLVRGTGIRGMTGIKPKQGRIIRPFLCVFRSEIEKYLTAQRISFLVDSTNLENNYVRNRFRNKVIPLLEEINPGVRTSLAKNIQHFRAAEKIYDVYIGKLREHFLSDKSVSIDIDGERLIQAPAPETLLFEWIGEWGFTFTQCCNVIQSLRKKQSGRRFQAVQSREKSVICRNNAGGLFPRKKDSLVRLVVDRGNVHIDTIDVHPPVLSSVPEMLHGDGAGLLGIQILDRMPDRLERNPMEAYFDLESLQLPLTVRRWQAGDVLFPFGMMGRRKKVSDLLIDAKVSVFNKERQLVILSGEDIVWVVGLRSDERYRVSEKTAHVLKIFVKSEKRFE
ncbi:MAG: tRNA lysidine(34) synthetase TilS [Paludibacteraceae bacterium]|nr:tRNA lysidine(34) synthetase TilS [Paludibacteraceae bacterium]